MLPGLPSTVFFVGAAACFSRSSPRFERWLLSLPVVGTLVDDFRAGRGMPLRSKVVTVVMIAGFSTLAMFTLDSVPVRVTIAVAALTGIGVVMLWVPTQRRTDPPSVTPDP